MWNHVASFGLFQPLEQIWASFKGFFFTFVEESIDNTLKVTDEAFNAGDHSVSKIDKQINPFEKTYGLIGICPTNVTAGLSIGYKIKINLNNLFYISFIKLKS